MAVLVVPLWLTIASLIFNIGWLTKLWIALVFGVTLAAPQYGLLLVALLAPLGRLIAESINDANFHIGEAIVVAFLAAWMIRRMPDRPGPRVPLPSAGWLFAATVASSVLMVGWQLRRDEGEVAAALRHIVFMYYYADGDWLGFAHAAALVEGMGLFVATVMLFRRFPALADHLPAALVASAGVAALSSVLLWRGVGFQSALVRLASNRLRVSAHVPDTNAAGSYFAGVLCLALGMALRRARPSRLGQSRMGSVLRAGGWAGLATLMAAGLWLSGSYSAMAAVVVVIAGAGAWRLTMGAHPGARRAIVTAVVLVALMAGTAGAFLAGPGRTVQGTDFRAQFATASARMIMARPLLGVGIGRYYQTSALFLSPQAAWNYGFENAHNYFLQIGSELGLVGLVFFVTWLGAAIALAARALGRHAGDARLLGVTGGTLAFLATCLTGHPMLINEVAYPFWIQLGLMTALAGSTLLNDATAVPGHVVIARRAAESTVQSRTRRPLTPVGVVAILGLTLVTAGRRPLEPSASQPVDGFYGWERAEDGTPFRWSGKFSSLFVPADVDRVSIPMRLPDNGRTLRPITVDARTGGVKTARVLVSDNWTVLEISLRRRDPLEQFVRVDLEVDHTWQPALYIAGSSDSRTVGVQVGRLRFGRN